MEKETEELLKTYSVIFNDGVVLEIRLVKFEDYEKEAIKYYDENKRCHLAIITKPKIKYKIEKRVNDKFESEKIYADEKTAREDARKMFDEFDDTLEQQDKSEETENNICNICKLNNQCPINHKPNLKCPIADYEKR